MDWTGLSLIVASLQPWAFDVMARLSIRLITGSLLSGGI